MSELSLEDLQKLRDGSALLNAEIENVNLLLDECHEDMVGMADVSDRIAKVFILYRELVRELQD
jgi:hypothetical protein